MPMTPRFSALIFFITRAALSTGERAKSNSLSIAVVRVCYGLASGSKSSLAIGS